MKKWKNCAGLLLATILCGSPGWSAPEEEEEEEEEPKLLGRCTAQQLDQEPFAQWFHEPYGDYEPNPEVLASLREVGTEGVDITVFFGTWCGDSQREIPRLLKLLDEMEFPAAQLTLVAVDGADEAAKRSPDGEEKGLEIYKVPTVVVSRDDREVARVVEHPVLSLERDLLAILSGESYEPNYISYPAVRRWLRQGLLGDDNVSAHGLAGQVRQEVRSEGELAAAARVLLSRGDVREAVKLYRVNCALYPRNSRAFARLAAALQQQGETEEAHEMAEKALRLNTDPARLKQLVQLVDSTKE
jgi:thiol-disulfide isomerase/thioredoxin